MRAEFGDTKNIWSWTGYTWDELLSGSEDKKELLGYLDIVVDGRFEQGLMDLNLAFKGSSNQRIIYVPASIEANEALLWEPKV